MTLKALCCARNGFKFKSKHTAVSAFSPLVSACLHSLTLLSLPLPSLKRRQAAPRHLTVPFLCAPPLNWLHLSSTYLLKSFSFLKVGLINWWAVNKTAEEFIAIWRVASRPGVMGKPSRSVVLRSSVSHICLREPFSWGHSLRVPCYEEVGSFALRSSCCFYKFLLHSSQQA